MLYPLNKMTGMTIVASDGEVGRIQDIYFDDHSWMTRYLVTDTGDSTGVHKVLIAFASIGAINWETHRVRVDLTRESVRNGPTTDRDEPISGVPAPERRGVLQDPHLRRATQMTGYQVMATDEAIGHVQSFLLDDDTLAIRYLVVDTQNWRPGKHVVIPPQWIKNVDWVDRIVNMDVRQDTVKSAPEYDPALNFSRTQETTLYAHYLRPDDWASDRHDAR
jgi:sporulation protein YlmC with PRC-barrel domain